MLHTPTLLVGEEEARALASQPCLAEKGLKIAIEILHAIPGCAPDLEHALCGRKHRQTGEGLFTHSSDADQKSVARDLCQFA